MGQSFLSVALYSVFFDYGNSPLLGMIVWNDSMYAGYFWVVGMVQPAWILIGLGYLLHWTLCSMEGS